MNRAVFLFAVLAALSGLVFSVTAQSPAARHKGRIADLGDAETIDKTSTLN